MFLAYAAAPELERVIKEQLPDARFCREWEVFERLAPMAQVAVVAVGPPDAVGQLDRLGRFRSAHPSTKVVLVLDDSLDDKVEVMRPDPDGDTIVYYLRS